MAFFDEISEKARVYAEIAAEKVKDAAGVAMEKAQDVKETARINMAILTEQRELDKNYRAIGEWFVAEQKDEAPEAIRDVVLAIVRNKEHIAELEANRPAKAEKSVEEVPQLKTCPVCGTVSNTKFCPECGAPLE